MKKSGLGREYVVLGRTLREVRERAKVTQVELAERLEQTQSYVSKCERGGVRLDFVQVRRMCVSLDVTFTEFVRKFENRLSSRD